VPPPYPADQYHSKAATPPRNPHVRGGNAGHLCASTARSVRASWRCGEATVARVCGARATATHSPAPHYIDPPNGPSHRKPIRVIILLESISGPCIIASRAYHQQSPTCTRNNHIGKFSFQPVKCVTRKVYMWVAVLQEPFLHHQSVEDLAGRTDSHAHIKIISAKTFWYTHSVIPLPQDTSQSQGEFCAILVILDHLTRSCSRLQFMTNSLVTLWLTL
jgi:hypothetical protein